MAGRESRFERCSSFSSPQFNHQGALKLRYWDEEIFRHQSDSLAWISYDLGELKAAPEISPLWCLQRMGRAAAPKFPPNSTCPCAVRAAAELHWLQKIWKSFSKAQNLSKYKIKVQNHLNMINAFLSWWKSNDCLVSWLKWSLPQTDGSRGKPPLPCFSGICQTNG